ncbi:MAG: DNA polymerase III subunit gamma/tau [Sulfurimonas sp.]|nr:DNA polymerase III subunit gamma/tau [Sulfurimonadaceae bacterium]
MDNSQVLARKYRPKNFDELIGQESVAQTLSLALDSNRLSHAYLFSGLRGSGKTSTARIFAKALVCEKGISHKPCEECSSCKMANENRHIDIIEMDGASNRGIDDIKDLIEQTKYKPASSRFKIFIIDEVHMLTIQASNALLKTLEEPPPYIKFILATTDPLKLPATILSRTQHFRFKNIAQNKIVEHLRYILAQENIEYEDEALSILARSGNGSLRDTLTLLDQAIIYSKNFVDVATVTDMLGVVDPKFLDELFDAILAKDKNTIIQKTKELDEYETDMVIDELVEYLKQKLYGGDNKYSTILIDRFFRVLSDAKGLLALNADGSFVLLLTFYKMLEALKLKDIDELIKTLEDSSLQKDAISVEKPQSLAPEALQLKEQKDDFTKLKERISDRNIALGECFNKSVEFVSFSDGVLTWQSCADEECKKTLTHGFGVIRQFVQEIYGVGTKISHTPCTKTTDEPKTTKDEPQEEPKEELDSTEESYPSSCVSDMMSQTNEIDSNDILKEPFVKKALDIFEPKKVTIQSKV